MLGGFSNLDDAVANRVVNPGDIHIFREIIDESGGVGFDTAEFSDARDNYTISGPDADGFITVSHDDPVLGAGQGADGVDRVRNVERLQFADQTIELVAGGNTLAAAGATIVVDATGVEAGPADIFVGQTLRADPSSIIDADGTDNSIFIHFWQFEEEPGSGVFVDFEIFNGSGEAGPLEGAVIDVPPEAEGFALRVKTIFQDDAGVFETVFSDPTEPAAPEVSTDPTPGDDNILGTVGIDVIDALAGDDVINSLAGNDIITGGPGSDIIDGGADIDTAVFSGDVADFLFAPPEEAEFDLEIVDTITEDEDLVVNVEFLQFDTNTSGLFGGATTIEVSDILDGETIIGGAGSQTLIGTDFNDVIDAGGGADIVSGEGGDDSIFGRGGADELEGGPGNDIVRGNGGNDVIGWRPGDGRDFINGGGNGALGDTVDIRTNGEGDTLRIWAVVETDDRNDFLALFPGVTLRNATEIVITYDPADGTGEAVIAEIRNVEELVINAEPAAAGVDADGTDISIIGNFDGTSLNQNTITINGSFNNDTVDISQLTSDHRVVFNTGGGTDSFVGDMRPQDQFNETDSTNDDDTEDDNDDNDDGDDQDDNDENDDDGDDQDDNDDDDSDDDDDGDSDSGSDGSTTADVPLTLIGDAASNTMFGGSAGDMISGLGSSDTLVSGDGDDTVVGGEGDDNVIGGEGDDLLIGEGGNDTIVGGAGNDFILGGDGADQILAGEGNDWINAGGGRDVVDGGAGDDTMVAALGDGDDVYRGGEGTDTLDMAAITADAFVDLNTGQAVSGQSGNDSISGFENVITGAGSDTIVANASVNVTTGGADEDMFVFNSTADADGDHITDFAPGDTIDLSGIAANYDFGGSFDLLADGATFSQAGQLIVRSDGSDLLVDGHVDADGTADFTIRVSGKSDLDQSDFG